MVLKYANTLNETSFDFFDERVKETDKIALETAV